MNDTDLRQLESFVASFHRAIKQFNFSETGLNLKNFPRECCHHACSLLGIFLFEQGFKNIVKIVGNRPDDSGPTGKHLWLNVDGMTVDITAYQFSGVQKEVIVEQFSDWHSALNGQPSSFGLDDEPLHEALARTKDFYNSRCHHLYDRIYEKTCTF